jgi:hypothetical protein
MWEKTREDGSRKLKINAVPTIFAFSQSLKTRKQPKTRGNIVKVQPHTVANSEVDPQPSTSHVETQGETQDSLSVLGKTIFKTKMGIQKKYSMHCYN